MQYVKDIKEWLNETLNDQEWINIGTEGRDDLRVTKDMIDIIMDMTGTDQPGQILFTCDMYMSGMDAQTIKNLATTNVQVPDMEKSIEVNDTIFYIQKYNYTFEDKSSAPIVICDVVDQGKGYSYVFIRVTDYKKFDGVNKTKYADIEHIPFEPDFENPDRNTFGNQ